HDVVVFDNLSTGHARAISDRARLVVGELADRKTVASLLARGGFDAAMHFAASIEVGESVRNPLLFYDNNVANSIGLLCALRSASVRRFVFSSTCATYGVPAKMPITEDMPQQPASPYARAKLAVEWALADSAAAWGLGFAALRYFNAAGAAADASIGEDHDPETHLIPNILKVPLHHADAVQVFGTDYPTPAVPCSRDSAPVDALADPPAPALEPPRDAQPRYYNCGTARGASVRETIEAARRVTGHPIPVRELPRRPGD